MSHPQAPRGAVMDVESTIRNDACFFGESQSRILVSFSAENRTAVEEKAKAFGAPFEVIGKVGGDSLVVNVNDEEFINEEVSHLKKLWMGALESYVR
jgi:phosphoribosylformylglycinamidine synthase